MSETSPPLLPASALTADPDGTLAANTDARIATQKALATALAAALATATTYADAKVADTISDGVTTVAPSENAVFDALALKAALASPAFTGNPTAPTASAGDNDTSLATTAFVTAAITAQKAYRLLFTGQAKFDAPSGATTGLQLAGAASPTGANGGLNVFYLDPADWPAGAVLRLKATLVTNDVAPAANFTFGLYPIGTPSGGAASIAAPFGTVIAGSTVAISAPAADSKNLAITSDFAAPAAGYYGLGVVISTNTAASSSLAVRAILDVRY